MQPFSLDVLDKAGKFGAKLAAFVHFFDIWRAFEFNIAKGRPLEGLNATVVLTLAAQPGMAAKTGMEGRISTGCIVNSS